MHTRGRRLVAIGCLFTLIIGCDTEPARSLRPEQGQAGAGDPYYPNDGNGGYDAIDYKVNIGYDPGSGHLDGETKMNARATLDLSRFNLDLRGLDVASVEVNGKPATFAREGEFELVITPTDVLQAGAEFNTKINYAGTPSPAEGEELGAAGWQRSSAGGAFALGEPHSAAFWYPVNETPRDKATFRLEARVPDGWSVVSNGRDEGTSSANGWTHFTWSEPKPTASYLTTIAIDKFQIDRAALQDGTPIVNAYAPGAENTRTENERFPEIISFLSEKFGDYPQDNGGGIFLNDVLDFSLETQGRPTYAKGADLETIVHENAHQWYGDSVTINSWSDICLNECFATYATWLWDEEKNGDNLDSKYRDTINIMRDKPHFWASKLYDMGQGQEFDGVYDKGAYAIHALRRKVGEDTFNKMLREWPAQHKGGNASWPQFEQFVNNISGQDLTAFLESWFHSTNIPADPDLYPGTLHS